LHVSWWVHIILWLERLCGKHDSRMWLLCVLHIVVGNVLVVMVLVMVMVLVLVLVVLVGMDVCPLWALGSHHHMKTNKFHLRSSSCTIISSIASSPPLNSLHPKCIPTDTYNPDRMLFPTSYTSLLRLVVRVNCACGISRCSYQCKLEMDVEV